MFCSFALIQSCSKDDTAVPDKCDSVTGATFSSNNGRLSGILQNKCGTSGCHLSGGEGSAHWVFSMNYDDLSSEFPPMYDAVIAGEMPPAGAPGLTQSELDAFKCWHDAGFPE